MGKILVVDKNFYQQAFLTTLLKQAGHQVIACDDPQRMIEIISQEILTLIIGDIFLDGLIWQKSGDCVYISTNNVNPIALNMPTIFYSPADIIKPIPDIYKALDVVDGMIDSSASPEEIISKMDYFLAEFPALSPLRIEVDKRNTLKNELYNVTILLKQVLEVGKFNAWEWNLNTMKVVDFGYASSISHPHGYFNAESSMSWFYNLIHPDDLELISTKLINIATLGEPFRVEYRLKIEDEMAWVVTHGKRFVDMINNRKKCIGIWTNITNDKNNEMLIKQQKSALNQIERINTLGELTSTLSHQITQPLHIIKSYVDGCINRLKSDDFNKADILIAMQSIANHVDLAGDIIQKMKDFIRKGDLKSETVNINDTIRQSLSLLGNEIEKNNIQINLELQQDIPLTDIDQIQIKQVIINLIQNSIDAMIDATIGSPSVTISSQLEDKHTAKIIITDNGPGIAPQAIDNLFVPCFSTKIDGMGIGLKVCKNIVEAHGGRIDVHKTDRNGTSFYFTLPILVEKYAYIS